MLRLLQKKLTPVQAEFTKHLLFVLGAHCVLLALLFVTSKTVSTMVLNIRTFQKADNVIIKWRSSSKRALPVKTVAHKTEAPVKIEPVKKNKPVPAPVKPAAKEPAKRFSALNQFSKIDLGLKKRRKKAHQTTNLRNRHKNQKLLSRLKRKKK